MKKRSEQILTQDELLAQLGISNLNRSYLLSKLIGDYRASVVSPDLSESPLDFMRAKILRGDFNELNVVNNENDLEIDFENMRLLCFKGEFAKAEEIATHLIAQKNISVLSMMTAHQVKSLCLFEQEKYLESIKEIELGLNLEVYFPYSEASLFLRQTLVRNYIMLGSLNDALKELFNIRNRIVSKSYNFNLRLQLMTYLRLVCFFKRSQNQDMLHEALAGLWIAKLAGARLYEGLFQLEIASCELQNSNQSLLGDLDKYLHEYSLIQYYYKKNQNNKIKVNTNMDFDFYARTPKHYVFLELGIVVDAEGLESKDIVLNEQHKIFLEILQQGKVTKEKIFKSLKGSEFHQLENDAFMRKYLQRMKSLLGINIESKGNLVSMPDSIIMDSKIII